MLRFAPLLFVTFLGACSSSVDQNALSGKYSAAIGPEHQTLQLNRNGTYENAFYRGEKLVWRYEDRWSYGRDAAFKGEAALTFDHFRFGLAGYDNQPVGFWPVQPERAWSGAVELCFDPDLNGRCFVQQKVQT
jgi:hypothetical protein